MPAETLTQAEQAAELLAKAEQLAAEAATALTDVSSLCEQPDGQPVPLREAEALLGRAYLVRRTAKWSVDEAEKAIEQLVFQVQLAEEHVEFAHIDAERGESGEGLGDG